MLCKPLGQHAGHGISGYCGLFKYEISGLFPCQRAKVLRRVWTWRVEMSGQRMEITELKTEQKKTQFGAGLQLPARLFPLKHLPGTELEFKALTRRKNSVVQPGGTETFGSSVSRD